MKKLFLILNFLPLFFFASSCSKSIEDGIYKGSYEEKTSWATYTANVEVSVEKGKITKVVLKESNIHSPSDTWADSDAWTKNYQKLLDSYVGLDVKKVVKSEKAPVDALSGATLSSDRLYFAIKDALTNK